LLEGDLKWQTYVVKNVGQLIAAAPCLSWTPTQDRIALAISAYINQVFQGNAAAAAHFVGIQHTTLLQWLKGKAIPQIHNLLQLTYCQKTSLLDFLSPEVLTADALNQAIPIQKERQQQQRQPCKRLNLQHF
jgi:hypothetical protein